MPGWAAAEGPRAVVVVASQLTPELVAEGLVREVVHAVQSQRKLLDLEFTDRIELVFDTASSELQAAIERHLEYVASETLAASARFGRLDGATGESIDIDGHPLTIGIRRLGKGHAEGGGEA
jgi:isoleucyl-tRNA synthetase